MPGAAGLEDAWLRARLGEPADPGTAYLTGKDAEAAACDALTIPVVTGHADMSVIDKIIALASAAPGSAASAGALQAHRYAIARLAVDFVTGPGGLARRLRPPRIRLRRPPHHAQERRRRDLRPQLRTVL